MARILVNFRKASSERPDPTGPKMSKKALDREWKKVYPARFVFERFTLWGCNGLLLNPVLKRVVEAGKAKIRLYFCNEMLIYIVFL